MGSLSVCVRTLEGDWSAWDVSLACEQRVYQGTRAMLMSIYVPADRMQREVSGPVVYVLLLFIGLILCNIILSNEFI